MSKKAFITGIGGQDGSYLAEYLLELGYEVYGMIRRNSIAENQQSRIEDIRDNVNVFYGDLLDPGSLDRLFKDIKPDEIYNLAAQSHVRVSYDIPQFTTQTNALGVLNVLESYRRICPEAKFYQASSSEMFGSSVDDDGFQRETTIMNPVSPYGCSKVFGYNIVRNYRNAYKLHATNGILFNHESPQRGETFLTRKVTRAAARIALGLDTCLYLGNLNAQRDWGHAKDYIEGMYLMLQQEKPEDFVLATGITTTIREFVKMAFAELGIELGFKGNDDKEEGYVIKNTGNYNLKEGQVVIKVDPKYYRPTEVDLLIGDPTKAMTKLGWKPKYDLTSLVKEMVASDLEIFKKELLLKENGYTITKESE